MGYYCIITLFKVNSTFRLRSLSSIVGRELSLLGAFPPFLSHFPFFFFFCSREKVILFSLFFHLFFSFLHLKQTWCDGVCPITLPFPFFFFYFYLFAFWHDITNEKGEWRLLFGKKLGAHLVIKTVFDLYTSIRFWTYFRQTANMAWYYFFALFTRLFVPHLGCGWRHDVLGQPLPKRVIRT